MCFNYAKKNVEQNNLSDLIKGDLGSWDLSGQKSLHGFLTFKEA